MRHQKHSNQLGVKKEHRAALMANLASALIHEGRIKTTLKKAKALRPFVERLITLGKKGGIANRRLAMARIRDAAAVQTLFDTRAPECADRQGGYTRIYKLGTQRLGDAAEMAIIEFVPANDPGYRANKRRKPAKKTESQAATSAAEEAVKSEAPEEAVEPEAPAEEHAKASAEAAETPTEGGETAEASADGEGSASSEEDGKAEGK